MRCRASVYHKDVPRYTGRRTRNNRSGFEMHYTQEQCKRNAAKDGRCYQHPRTGGYNITDVPWAED